MIKHHVYSNIQSSWTDDYYISILKNNIFKLIRRRVGEYTDWKAYIKFSSPKDFLDRFYNNNVFDTDLDHEKIIIGLKKYSEFKLLALVINKYQEEINNKVYSEEEELFINLIFQFILTSLINNKINKTLISKIFINIRKYIYEHDCFPKKVMTIYGIKILPTKYSDPLLKKLKKILFELKIEKYIENSQYGKLIQKKLQYDPNKYRKETVKHFIRKYFKKYKTFPKGEHLVQDFKVLFR